MFHRELAWLYLKGLLLAVVFGAVGALAAEGFRHGLELATQALFGRDLDISVIMGDLAWVAKLGVPAAGGLIAGLILVYADRYQKARGFGGGDYLETIDGRTGAIPAVPSLLRCLSSFCSIVSGGSIGKEGAMVQLSSTIASMVARRIDWLRGERFQMTIAVAATGGLAAVYHTPLAAAIFIAEIAFGGIEFRRLALLFTAAVVATWIVSAMGQFTPTYPLPVHAFDLDASALAVTIIVGIVAGLGGALMLAAIRSGKRVFALVPGGIVARMTLGGLIVGGIICVAPEVAGNGFFPITQLLGGDMLTTAVLALLALKIIATAATVGAGAVGGLFTPALLIGALSGMSCIAGLNALLGTDHSPVLFAVVGMAAALAATTQAPLMSTLMVFEMTQEPLLIFPIMLATVVAYGTANVVGQPGTYAIIDRHRLRFASRSRLYELTAGTAMRPLDRFVLDTATLQEAWDVGHEAKNRFVFVLDADHAFVGAVWMHDIVDEMGRSESDGTPRTLLSLISPEFPTLFANDRLVDIWEKVVASPAERLPVLADGTSKRVMGVLPKSVVLEQARRAFV